MKANGWLVGACLGLGACSAASTPAVEVSEVSPVDSSSTDEALQKNALTAAESKTVLRLIDNVCGDTWCDGDYNFGFRRLTCAKATETCTLTLQAFPIEGVVSAQRSYWRSCKTPGFTGFKSLVSTAPNGYQSLNGEYYDALTACVSQIVSKLGG